MDDENLLDPDDEQGQSTEEHLEEDIADDIDLEFDGNEGSPADSGLAWRPNPD